MACKKALELVLSILLTSMYQLTFHFLNFLHSLEIRIRLGEDLGLTSAFSTPLLLMDHLRNRRGQLDGLKLIAASLLLGGMEHQALGDKLPNTAVLYAVGKELSKILGSHNRNSAGRKIFDVAEYVTSMVNTVGVGHWAAFSEERRTQQVNIVRSRMVSLFFYIS